MGTTPKRLSDQIRAAIEASGKTRYRICMDADLSEGTLSRFMRHKGWIGEEAMDRLAAYLGLQVVVGEPGKGAGPQETKGR